MAAVRQPLVWQLREERLDLTRRPLIVGILNVTPDSFYDGGRHVSPEQAVARAEEMWRAGAELIDVGGESTRPGAPDTPEDEQRRRIEPVMERLAERGIRFSVDARRASVARAALERGAAAVNDVSGLADPEMPALVASRGASLVLMHSKGEPRTMQDAPRYDDVVGEVSAWLDARVRLALDAGVVRERLALDVGIGFGKRVEDNLQLLRRLDEFHTLGLPLMIGVSRKSFLGAVGAGERPAERLAGSLVAAVWAWARGARLFRVHDVEETRRALACQQAIEAETDGGGRKA